ncbi:class I adenylate-forming enzyme family protein [Elongatibacter sediminis]|uniref:Class I adenylate-forming enzyme family protein n=1 Tax=Elongatibacter sediminis TaxID=3119006 RepID=A0AAW9RGW3_9GAMM
MSDIHIITEQDIAEDTNLLQRRWTEPNTFVLLPARQEIHRHWIGNATRLITKHCPTDSFALLTSGSTGQPRLIVGNRNRSEALARVLHEQQNSEPVDETVCTLPLSYSFAFINQWLWSHVFQRKLRLTEGFSAPDRLMQILAGASNAMLCLVGSQVPLIRRFFPEASFPGIIRVHFAGGRFPQEELDFLKERFPNAEIYNNYGCAEAMPRLSMRRAGDAEDASHVGCPLPGVELRSDPSHRLLFRSPYRAIALIDDTRLHHVDDEEWLPTGDLGIIGTDGGVRLMGRANDVFKRHGEKISLPQLMTTVKEHWAGDAAFYTDQDASCESGCVLVLAPVPTPEQVREVLMGFRKYHTRPHWPLRVESLESMPLLPNGKIDLKGLPGAGNTQVHWKQRI